jgi:hypothetical protein
MKIKKLRRPCPGLWLTTFVAAAAAFAKQLAFSVYIIIANDDRRAVFTIYVIVRSFANHTLSIYKIYMKIICVSLFYVPVWKEAKQKEGRKNTLLISFKGYIGD